MRTTTLLWLVLAAGCAPAPPAPLPVAPPPPTAAAPVRFRPSDATRGRAEYRRHCAACHGRTGAGDGPNARHVGRPVPRLDRAVRSVDSLVSTLMRAAPRMHVQRDRPRLRRIARYLAGPLHEEPAHPGVRLSGADQPGCDSCHDRPARMIVGQANCAGCHLLPGGRRERVGPPLTGIGSRFRPAFLRRFLKHPYNRRQLGYLPMRQTRMPDFDLSDQEAADLAALLDRSRVPLPAAPPPDPALVRLGRRLVAQKGCLDCHRLGKQGGRFGPDLTSVGARLRWPYLFAWLRAPRALSPDTPMPDPELDPRETLAVASFLATRRAPTIEDAAGRTATRGRPEAGLRLLRELRCTACHAYEDEPPPRRRVAMPLQGERASRDWLYAFLDRTTRSKRHGGRMPRFRFTGPERAALADHLRRLVGRDR